MRPLATMQAFSPYWRPYRRRRTQADPVKTAPLGERTLLNEPQMLMSGRSKGHTCVEDTSHLPLVA